MELNTSSDEGRRLVVGLLRSSGPGGGILLTNAVGQRWLDYEALRAERPDLIMVHILGRSDGKPAVDYVINSEVGLPLITGPVDLDRPVNHVLPAWDLLRVLRRPRDPGRRAGRARTGQGQLVSVSLANVAVATMAHLGFVADVVVNGQGRRENGLPVRQLRLRLLHRRWPPGDGRGPDSPAHWRSLVELSGVGEAIAALERSLGVNLTDEEAHTATGRCWPPSSAPGSKPAL